jgi:hypothetical protein
VSQYAEDNVEKVSRQPLCHDPTFINPTTDDDDAEGFVMTVFCDAPPDDGDVAVFVAANNRFELRAAGAGLLQPMLVQDESTGVYGFLVDADGNLLYGYPE